MWLRSPPELERKRFALTSLQIYPDSPGVVNVILLKNQKKRRKEIGKGTAEPARNRVTVEEANEFLKTIRMPNYSVIQ